MNVTELTPPVDVHVQFTLRHRKFVPLVPGCYALTTFAGDVLYVGLSKNLNQRFAEHRDNPGKSEPTALGLAFWFYYITCPLNGVNKIERTWLNQSVTLDGVFPILNKINSPVH